MTHLECWAPQCKKADAGTSLVKGHEYGKEPGVFLIWEAENAETVQPREKKTQDDLINVYKTWWWNEDKGVRLSSVMPVTGRRTRAQIKKRRIPSENTFLLWGWSIIGAGCSERLWNLHMILKAHLDTVLNNLTLFQQVGWTTRFLLTCTILWFLSRFKNYSSN